MNKIPVPVAVGLVVVAIIVLVLGIKWGISSQSTNVPTPTGPPTQAMKEMQKSPANPSGKRNNSPFGR